MLVGLVSDTHGVYDEALEPIFGADRIQHLLHAGDVGHHGGSLQVLAALRGLCPSLWAVRGNTDDDAEALSATEMVRAQEGKTPDGEVVAVVEGTVTSHGLATATDAALSAGPDVPALPASSEDSIHPQVAGRTMPNNVCHQQLCTNRRPLAAHQPRKRSKTSISAKAAKISKQGEPDALDRLQVVSLNVTLLHESPAITIAAAAPPPPNATAMLHPLLPEHRVLQLAGWRVLLLHIVGKPPAGAQL